MVSRNKCFLKYFVTPDQKYYNGVNIAFVAPQYAIPGDIFYITVKIHTCKNLLDLKMAKNLLKPEELAVLTKILHFIFFSSNETFLNNHI